MSTILLLLAHAAHAIDAHGFDLGTLDGDARAYPRLGYPSSGRLGDWDAGLVFDWANAPLAEALPEGRVPVVDALGTTTFAGAFSLGGVRLDAQLPVVLYGSDPQGSFQALGDARVSAMAPLLEGHGAWPSIGLRTAAWSPTGDASRFVGASGTRLQAELVAAREFDAGNLGGFGAILSIGGRAGARETARNLEAGAGPVVGIGGAWRATKTFSASFELLGASDVGWSSLPLEATLGMRVRLPWGGWATAGTAAGLGSGVGAAQSRAFVGVGWGGRSQPDAPTPDAVVEAAAASVAEVVAFEPYADRDADGLTDGVDRCPDNPETVDGFTDEDGCPELDSDRDGVPFERDACPREAILEAQDPRRSDGCPRAVAFEGDRIVIAETLHFREGRAELVPSAEKLVAEIAAVMNAHPEIGHFLVEGHTNSNGADAYNLRLSDARAFAVLQALSAHGVSAARLLSKGYGETRPLVPESHPDAPAINRRVEFKVVRVEEVPADARTVNVPSDAR